MLQFEGLTQADLHPDLIPFAQIPRLFSLVVRFRDRLIDAGQVTVHRLLWEYGRDTFGARAGHSFSEADWRAWLQEIARRHFDGVREYTLRTLGDTTKRADLSENEVFARLSDILDGPFAETDSQNNVHLSPTVVAHGLGLALLAQLDVLESPSFERTEQELNKWLDPINGLDQRAEILRAAVSIMVERGALPPQPVASGLVAAWLQSQNVPDEHRTEVARLAVEIVEPLLETIERSSGHAQAAARIWAVNALRAIPRDNAVALRAIVACARRWLSVVSRDVDPPGTRNAESERRRSERFTSRVGVDHSGQRTVLSVPLTFVDRAFDTAAVAVPSLLEGFPLTSAVPVFEVAAISLAVRGRSDLWWDGLKWVCLFNEVDSDDTAWAIRSLSAEVAERSPEPGVHPQLPARTAAILLWLTGEEEDERGAASLDPGIDHQLSYEDDYLRNPGRSLFALERRHAKPVLLDRSLPMAGRAMRAKDFLLDPNFEPPKLFVSELREELANFDVSVLDTRMSQTAPDHNFEELEPVLARCAPDLLASLVRRKLAGYATRSPESLYPSAIGATDHLVLTDGGTAAGVRALRQRTSGIDDGQDAFAATRLLMLEISDLEGVDQVAAFIEADLESIFVDVGDVLRPLNCDDVDALIEHYELASAKRISDLVALLSLTDVSLSDEAWAWFSGLAFDEAFAQRGMAFRILAETDAARFGLELLEADWSWGVESDNWINHYGSIALIAATLGHPFESVAARIAPWLLFNAVRERGASRADAALAACIYHSVLAAPGVEAPDPGSQLSIDRERRATDPFAYTIVPSLVGQDDDSPVASLQAAMDADAQVEARRRAAETAVQRVRKARMSGASLYLVNFCAEDFMPIIRHVPEAVDSWLEGADEPSKDFRRRVHLAEGGFLALCEALLDADPERGAALWWSLRRTLSVRFIGPAQVDEMTHMVFRAPKSAATDALLSQMLDLENTNTDEDLLDLSIAAAVNDRTAWLRQVIEADHQSNVAWRRRRALMLEGFSTGNALPVEGAWPKGPLETAPDARRGRAAKWRHNEACARYWWQRYWRAASTEEAYAAWILFLHAADRRAFAWMSDEMADADTGDALTHRKLAHVRVNYHRLKTVVGKRERRLGHNFLDKRTINGIGPWGKVGG